MILCWTYNLLSYCSITVKQSLFQAHAFHLKTYSEVWSDCVCVCSLWLSINVFMLCELIWVCRLCCGVICTIVHYKWQIDNISTQHIYILATQRVIVIVWMHLFFSLSKFVVVFLPFFVVISFVCYVVYALVHNFFLSMFS